MQWGFYFNQSRCVACYTCVVACKDWNDIAAGPVSWRQVTVKEEGKYPEVSVYHLSISCNHCINPPCVKTCPVGALSKRQEEGIVLVDRGKCIGCRTCKRSCPYGAPQFGLEEKAKMQKCNFCLERVLSGNKPICVEACPLRALDAGPLEELKNKYRGKRTAKGFPGDIQGANPSIIFSHQLSAVSI